MKRKQDLTNTQKVLVGTMSTEERCYSCQYLQITAENQTFKMQTALSGEAFFNFIDDLQNIESFLHTTRGDFIIAAIQSAKDNLKDAEYAKDQFNYKDRKSQVGEEKAKEMRNRLTDNFRARLKYLERLEDI